MTIKDMQKLVDSELPKYTDTSSYLSDIIRDALEFNYGSNRHGLIAWRFQALMTLKKYAPKVFADLDPEARRVDWDGKLKKEVCND